MRRLLFTFLVFLWVSESFGQDLIGNWQWEENSEERSFRIALYKNKDKTTSKYLINGIHCGIYYNGGRVDCASSFSILLNPGDLENKWEGTIKSDYSGKTSEITITYFPENDRMKWEIQKAYGQFYFPHDAILKREGS